MTQNPKFVCVTCIIYNVTIQVIIWQIMLTTIMTDTNSSYKQKPCQKPCQQYTEEHIYTASKLTGERKKPQLP